MKPDAIIPLDLQAVAFDFDGVVADTMPMLSRLGRYVIQIHYDVPRHTASQLYWQTVGLPFIEQLKEIFGINDQRNRNAAEYFEARKEELMPEAQPFSDIQQVLDALPAANIRTALCSSTRCSLIENFCKKHHLQFLWLGGVEKGHKHEQIRQFVKTCSLSPKHVLFLGDSSKRDATFAQQAEVQFAPVTHEREIITELTYKYVVQTS